MSHETPNGHVPEYKFEDRGPYDTAIDSVVHAAQREAFEAAAVRNSGIEDELFNPEYVEQLRQRAVELASDANAALARRSHIEAEL